MTGRWVPMTLALALAGCAVGHRVVGTPVTPPPAAGTDYQVRNGGSEPVDWFVVHATRPDPDGEHGIATPRAKGLELTRYHTSTFVVFRRLDPGERVALRVLDEPPAETDPGIVYLVAPDVAEAIEVHGTVLMFAECGEGAPPERIYSDRRKKGAEITDVR